ncbi:MULTISPECIES: galactan 5-O-arabinofuranosyltransferase [Corynebacterium]|uniref:galactan 5-O-arabinofuranosyltransferase n=1 Tax=Corynebacterium TaxID=1716 RepID=UPI00195BE0A9|nr:MULTISPECIES: galactan 5-O-arabinofuranosyltransferase [Corynebacterium]QRQ65448.1 galactan 5-O-arabinofuranosyltransferase [Corynebacterium kroppenstedtii]
MAISPLSHRYAMIYPMASKKGSDTSHKDPASTPVADSTTTTHDADSVANVDTATPEDPILPATSHSADHIGLSRTIINMVLAVIGGGTMALIFWRLMKTTHYPAFSNSNVLKALSTLTSAILIIVVAALLIWWVHDEKHVGRSSVAKNTAARNKESGAPSPAVRRPRWRVWLTYIITYISPAGLVGTVLTIPLSATRLYLDGISVDQAFRTQFLTRMTAQIGLHDMAYPDIPTFYPAGWFMTGGRFAHYTGLAGWAAFQPWAIITLSAAACMLVPVWQRITGSLPLATTIALTTTAIMLSLSSFEPYAAIVGMGIPAAAVFAWRAINGARWSALATAIFLGASATLYTLFTGVNALAIVVIGLVIAIRRKSFLPIIRLAGIGIGSLLIAATVWAPYIKDLLTKPHGSTDTAQHYLPTDGTQIPTPMFHMTVLGFLCLIGVIWLIVRFTHPIAMPIAIAVLTYYAWVLLSMAATLHGTTLLGFRLEPPITMLLATAGVLGLRDALAHGIPALYPERFATAAPTITLVIGVLVGIAATEFAATIPWSISHSINSAYSDTDGDGHRNDGIPADSGTYYQKVVDTIGREPTDTVLLADEQAFMAYHPYLEFQALTAHYANPLGEFEQRNAAIEKWSEAETPEELNSAMDDMPWRKPDAILFRGSIDDDDWALNVADDVYPSDPNVHFRSMHFHPKAFSDWTVTQVGPFVVAVRPQ